MAWAWADRGRFAPLGQWLAVDALGLLFLAVGSALFLGIAVYAAAFLGRGQRRGRWRGCRGAASEAPSALREAHFACLAAGLPGGDDAWSP